MRLSARRRSPSPRRPPPTVPANAAGALADGNRAATHPARGPAVAHRAPRRASLAPPHLRVHPDDRLRRVLLAEPCAPVDPQQAAAEHLDERDRGWAAVAGC